ncbi:hypothetical protein F5Y08DRAFT_227590 [Xylaria arbuscula]|nr:hypothetical protein F5Y08DRAFT_227590 [Xylaria arbuscula]
MAAYLTTMPAKHNEPIMLQRAVTSSHRPQHQLRRSITEQSPPFKQSRVHQYLYRKDRDRDDRLPLSAGPSGRGSLELLRADVVSSARIGMVLGGGDDVPTAGEIGASHHILRNDDNAQEKNEAAVAASAAAISSLKTSLVELNTFSNATIARLEETYSTILQRLGSLKSTMVALKELAAMSQELNESFNNESRALVSEIESQLGVYDQSTEQKKCIQDLQARIQAGRDKVQALSKRVDIVRDRIEGWKKADKEWQERTRKRLKIIWIIISIVTFVLVVLFIGAQYAPTDITKLAEVAPTALGGKPSLESFAGNNSRSAATMAEEVREELTLRRVPESGDEAVLRIFDEL